MLKQFELIYRQYGIRRLQNLLMPKTFDINEFHFSRNAVYHSVSHDLSSIFPDPSISYLLELNKRIYTEHITTLTSDKGNPRRLNTQPLAIIKPFHFAHKKFKFLRDARVMNKDQSSLDVVNYGTLQEFYRYPIKPLINYYRWFNIEKTVWDNVKITCKESDRQNYIFFNVPKVIPSLTLLRLFTSRESTSLIKVFNTNEKLSVLDFFRWINPESRELSTIGSLTTDELRKINIVFRFNNKWVLLNLAYFNSWIDHEDTIKDESIKTTNISFKPQQIQKFFLRMLMSIQTSGVINEEEIEETIPVTIDKEVNEDEGDSDKLVTGIIDTSKDSKLEVGITNTIQKIDDDIDVEFDDVIDVNTIISDLDKDMEVLEEVAKRELQLKGLHVNTDKIQEPDNKIITPTYNDEIIEEKVITTKSLQDLHNIVYNDKTDQDLLLEHIQNSTDYGLMTASEFKSMNKLADKFNELKSPYDNKQTIEQHSIIKPEELKIDNEHAKLKDTNVIDKTMLESRLNVFDKQYIKKVMKKNIINSVTSVRRAGVIVQDYQIEDDSSMLGDFEIHTLKLKPIEGASSTIRFKLPVVSEDGTFKVSGNTYTMRKQRTEKPLVKVDESNVSLTSYYSKIFISRSYKKVNDYSDWIIKQIYEIGFGGNGNISKLSPANVFEPHLKQPKIYSIISKEFKSLTIGTYNLLFDRNELIKLLPNMLKYENDSYRLAGVNNKYLILVDYDDEFFKFDLETHEYTNIGDINKLAMLNKSKAPIDFSTIKIFTKIIPVVILLGYFLGIDNLLKLLGMELDRDYRFIEGNKRIDLGHDETYIAFSDKKLVISLKHKLGVMILTGFNEYYKIVKEYDYDLYNHKDVYFNLLDSVKIGARYIKEFDLLDQMFIDPITKDLLKHDNLPITFKGLLIYSSNLLTYDYYPDKRGTERVRGYERFSGAVYKELVTSIRNFKGRGIRGKSAVEMNPYAIWKTVTGDSANILVADINPIENLKQSEYLTYTGEGGRDSGAITKETRVYVKSDMGFVSEATVDSSDVAINTYMPANPLLTSVYGTVEDYDFSKHGAASLFSTTSMCAPGIENEDAKRINFSSIQNSHTIPIENYSQPIVRTGYEQLIAQRTSSIFAKAAIDDGVVTSKNDKGIIVKYKNGEYTGVILGRRFGNAEGSTYPHDIVTTLDVGDKVSKGDVIAYNTGFFEPDILNPKNVIWKSSMPVKTVLYESNQTHEDSSAVSTKISNLLTAKTTKIRSIVINFNESITNIPKLKSQLLPKDFLCVIEDDVTSGTDLMNTDTLEALKRLSNKAPKSKYKGVLDKIEVIYHGDVEDMTPTLKALTNQSDRLMIDTAKATGGKPHTGSVNTDYRVAGTPLALDTAEIKFYITIETGVGTADKVVFGNQMKSTVGEVMVSKMVTENGEDIDAVFGYRSIYNRIVDSPLLIGTTITLLSIVAKKALEIYKGK